MTADSPGAEIGMALGRQMTVEYYECNPRILADPGRMEAIFLEAAERSGATVICSRFHAFEPQGVSGMVIISESHFAVHAWPEFDYAAVDIFTCGDSIDFDVAVDALRSGLESQQAIVSSVMNRGIVNPQGVERLVTVCEDRTSRYALSWRSRFERTRARGISAVVDLYDCTVFGEEDARRITEKLAQCLEAEPVGDMLFRTCREGMISLRRDFCCGLLSGHLDPASGTVYLDVFSCKFFEPRTVAELALAGFGGHHYRMQVAIRQ